MLARYLRLLSVFYAMGFLLHLGDLLDLRLKFSEMSPGWRAWVIYLAFFDGAAAIGLWKQTRWGVGAFFLVALSQLVAYLGFEAYFGQQAILVWFHIVTVTTCAALKLRAIAQRNLAQSRHTTRIHEMLKNGNADREFPGIVNEMTFGPVDGLDPGSAGRIPCGGQNPHERQQRNSTHPVP